MFNSGFIITYLSAVLGFHVFICSYRYFVEIKSDNSKKDKLIIMIFSIFMALNNLHNSPYLKVPTTIFIITIFFFITYRNSFYQSIFLSNFISLISLISEFVISIIISIIAIDFSAVNASLLMKAGFSIIYFWSFYFIYKIPFLKYLYKKTSVVFEKNKEIMIFIYCFLFVIGCMYVIYAGNLENIKVYLLFIIIISLISSVMYFYFKELHYNRILNVKNKYLIENQLLFKNALEDYRVLKHNLLNDFLFIGSLCKIDVQKIINEKITKYNINSDNFNDISNIPEGLQGIVYFKSGIARKLNIELYIDGNSNFIDYNSHKKLYIDLCDIIGIVLDNAIEAASIANFKAIYLNFYSDNNNIRIEVLNTYVNDIDLSCIGQKNCSTKNRNSGLGLYYIEKLNENIVIKKSIINNLFKMEISTKIK